MCPLGRHLENTVQISKTFSLFAVLLCLILGACGSSGDKAETEDWQDSHRVDSGGDLLVLYDSRAVDDSSILGWIYAFGHLDGGPNRCVYVRKDETWLLADETSPGYFATNKVSGSFRSGARGWSAAAGFPEEALVGYSKLYSAGRVRANYSGRHLPRNN